MKNKNNSNSENTEYQVIATNIKYGKELKTYKNRPEITTIDVPEYICNIKDIKKFNDTLESFVYNIITKRYGAEVSFCQIYIP